MTVGTLTVRIVIRQARSLKDKRRVVRSILDQARRHFNVCAIESGTRDARQQATLCFASLADGRRMVESTLQKVANMIRRRPDGELVDFEIETF